MLRKMYEYEQQDSSLMLRSVGADVTPVLIRSSKRSTVGVQRGMSAAQRTRAALLLLLLLVEMEVMLLLLLLLT